MRENSIYKNISYNKNEIIKWRRDFHQEPELGFEEKNTSKKVKKILESFGINVYSNYAKTGLVGVLKNGLSNRSIALRADMDALPILEKNRMSYRSKNNGVMHACGHDGHMAMLLGAAKYLSASKNFDGTVYFIFQPAEEISMGAKQMIQDGLLKRFKIDEIYGLHNMFGMTEGQFSICRGPILASYDVFKVEIMGKSVHAAFPDKGINPILIASEAINLIQNISSQVDLEGDAVLAITKINSGIADNIIPDRAILSGSIRTFNDKTRDVFEGRIKNIMELLAKQHKTKYVFNYERRIPSVVNENTTTKFALEAAQKIVQKISQNDKPILVSEDFAFFLEKIPGCIVHLGIGLAKGSAHTERYDFNDRVLVTGSTFWSQLVEDRLKK